MNNLFRFTIFGMILICYTGTLSLSADTILNNVNANNMGLLKKCAKSIQKSFYYKPYVLEIKKKRGGLLYYGSFHNVDPEHPQFKDIEGKWNKFKPEIVYSEGSLWPLERSKKKAIEKHGEQGLLRYLAHRDKVKIICIEPQKRNEILYLLKKFTSTKIKIYYILRQMIINREIFNKDTDLDYIRFMLKKMGKMNFFSISLKTVEDFSTMVKALLPDLKNWKNIDSKYFMNVLNKKNWLAKINVRINKYRNKYMVKKIIKQLKKGKKVFVVVGKSHVLEQEKILLSKTCKMS